MKTFPLKMEDSLHARLKASAHKNEISIQKLVAGILSHWVDGKLTYEVPLRPIPTPARLVTEQEGQ